MSQIKPGNLLLVSNYPSDTAYAWWLIEHFWVSIAEHLAIEGIEIYLAYPEVTSLSSKIRNSPIKVVELTIPWRNKDQLARDVRFIREHRISYIYFSDQPYFTLQYAIMRFAGVRKIINHDHTPGDRPPVTGVKGLLKAAKNSLTWFTPDLVICVSEHMRQRNLSNARLAASKCKVVLNGIQPVECGGNSQGASIKKVLGIDEESLVVITTGRAHPYKRFDFIIDAANEVTKMDPNARITFLLIGDGPAMPELAQHVENLGLNDTVRLLGYRDDVRDLLCTADIAIHAALGEGFSLSIIEYMSAGLPVLVPDIASVSQAITHDITGLIYSRDDPVSAANRILELYRHSDSRLSMGNAAKAEANKHYRLEQCTESLLATVASTLR